MKTKEELAIEYARNMIPKPIFSINDPPFIEFHLAKNSFIAGYDAAYKEVEELEYKLKIATTRLEFISHDCMNSEFCPSRETMRKVAIEALKEIKGK